MLPMGVSRAGKTAVGERLAARIRLAMIDVKEIT